MSIRGAIYDKARYYQGFDHSPWGDILPRKITPSDIDVVFDSHLNARMLFCDFTCAGTLWGTKPYGQRLLYQQLLRTNNYGNASVLCYHNVPKDREIDTVKDVISFHVMRCIEGRIVMLPDANTAYGGHLWTDFVLAFYSIKNNWGTW